jgi:phytoene synthase
MDLDQHRYAKFDDLREYCTHAMSGVDVLSAKILGYIEPRTLSSAKTLGVAFRLTNIVRNIGKDARRGRIYLPIDELASFNVSISDIQHARETPNFKRLVEFQIMRVLGFYRDADALLLPIDRKAQRPRLVLEAIYRTLLDEILADGCCVLTRRLSLTPLRKLWITWKTRMME